MVIALTVEINNRAKMAPIALPPLAPKAWSATMTPTSSFPSRIEIGAALKKVKIDLDRHKSQPVTQDLIDRAFLILGMTQSHIDILNYYHTGLPERVHLFREFMGKDEPPEIPDPYGQNYTAYAACFDSMAEAIPSLVAYLKNEYTI